MSDIAVTRSPGAAIAAAHRLRTAVLLGAVTSFAPFATDMYLGSLGDIARSLRVDAGGAQITVSTFFAGMAVGQVFYGPAIDRWGRRGPLWLPPLPSRGPPHRCRRRRASVLRGHASRRSGSAPIRPQ